MYRFENIMTVTILIILFNKSRLFTKLYLQNKDGGGKGRVPIGYSTRACFNV